MIKTIPLFFLFLSFNLAYSIPTNIIIRNATHKDLPAIFDLDKVVSYEYFLPLYVQGYSHLPLGKNPTYFLGLELEKDKKWFPECINGNAESLWIAYDQNKNKLAGLIVAHQSSSEVKLDLLLILKEYRRKGIGKSLVYHAIDSFPAVATCELYPFQFANDATLAFYQAIGFVNQGIPTIDKTNIYGIHYKDMYYHFTWDLFSQPAINSN